MNWERFVIGYHGTTLDVAKKVVLREDNLKASSNEYDWLGTGIYFWEDNPTRAWEWAVSLVKNKRGATPAVLGALIDLGSCLNPTDATNQALVVEAFNDLTKLMRGLKQPMPKNSGNGLGRRNLDCAVFNYLHHIRENPPAESGLEPKPPFHSERSFFSEGAPLYKTSGIRNADHIQVCVRDLDRIQGYCICDRPRT
jgi:hypothetical protein